jgi:hypothetical protein
MYEMSETARRITALIRNSRQLAVRHQQRSMAADVARAVKMAIINYDFLEDLTAIDELILAIPEKMNEPLSHMFSRAEAAVAAADFKRAGQRELKTDLKTSF